MANDPGLADPDKAAAMQLEANDRAVADHRARPQESPAPIIVDGETCCRDCEYPIPADRLTANPGAGRCTPCQAEAESGRG